MINNPTINSSTLRNILFLDIETVPMVADYNELDEDFKKLWDKKSSNISVLSSIKSSGKIEISPSDIFKDRAAIYSEFGKIVVISMGFIATNSDNEPTLRLTSLQNDNEKELLDEFSEMLSKKFSRQTILCGHNSKEFDFPYICRRMVINGIRLPHILDLSGKKPWEVQHLDTMELWKFGDRKAYTSLDLLAKVLNIKSSKAFMDGGDVYEEYYHNKDLDKISAYCALDVTVTAQVFLRMHNFDIIKDENIIYSDYSDRSKISLHI